MSFTGIKDLDREILKYIPEENLLKLCAINNRMYNEVCDDDFIKRRLSKYSNIENYKSSSQSWKRFFTSFIHYREKMIKEFDFEYVRGDFKKQYQMLKKCPNKLTLLLRKQKYTAGNPDHDFSIVVNGEILA